MIKNYIVTVTSINHYPINIAFDSSNTALWYEYDEAAAIDQFKFGVKNG
jgi:hypothetical protein